MRRPLLLSLLALGACAGPLPAPDPQQAWVELQARAGYTLMAHRLDGTPIRDGRYFQLAPGTHELQLRFQFEVPGGAGETGREPRLTTCLLRLDYDGFAAGQRYRIEARAPAMQPSAYLYDAQRKLVAEEQNDIFCIP